MENYTKTEGAGLSLIFEEIFGGTMQVRKRPPEFSEGRILCTLSHKDLKSLVNQAVDALKYALNPRPQPSTLKPWMSSSTPSLPSSQHCQRT